MEKLLIGYAGIHFSPFYGFEAEQSARRRESLLAEVNRMHCSLAPGGNLFSDASGAEAAAKSLKGADLVILDVCTFPEGKAWMRFVELVDAPLAIWSRPETLKDGPVGHNSFCGANYINSCLLREGRRARRLFGEPSSRDFRRRLSAAVEILSAAKSARGSRIGLIGGGIVPKFNDIDMPEPCRKRLAAKWDINFDDISFEELWEEADRAPAKELDAETARQSALYCRVEVPLEKLREQSAMLLGAKRLSERRNLAALAVRCWPEFGAKRALWPCGLIGHLNELGIPAACEGDPVGALDMLLASKISKEPVSLLDVIDFDDKAGTMTLWHCGPGSPSCSDGCGMALLPHMVDGKGADGKPAKGHPAIHDMAYKPGEASILRTLGALDDEFILSGTLMPVSGGHVTGSCGSLGSVSHYGRRASMAEVREMILSRGIPHHYAMFYRNA